MISIIRTESPRYCLAQREDALVFDDGACDDDSDVRSTGSSLSFKLSPLNRSYHDAEKRRVVDVYFAGNLQ